MTTRTRKISKRFLLGGLLFIGLLIGLAFTINYLRSTPTIFDRPSNLNEKIETIEVLYMNWACDCPNFIETKYYKNKPDYEVKEKDCIFIEPANSALKVPDSFYSNDHFEKKLRLTGQFYQTEGIPKTYEQKTPEKPERAKVFHYSKLEIINNEN